VRLLRSQWLPASELASLQRAKLQPLIAHAYERVPYYRRLLDRHGVRPGDIREVADLAKLPITTKAELAALPLEDRLASGIDPRRCVDLRTSGSEGMPFDVRFRRTDRDWWALLALRGWLANGYRPTQRMLVLDDAKSARRSARWYEALGLFRQQLTSIWEPIEVQLERARSLEPQVIRGMTSDVRRLGEALAGQGEPAIRPTLVLTSAELMDATTRRQITESFGVTPVDFYGAIESGWIGWECPAHSGYHLNADCLIVEFLRDGQPVHPGEPGEVVVTNLHAYAMPFIRYSVGDLGVPDDAPCACGRGLPLMRSVEGRTVDCLALPGGRVVSPYQLTCTLEQIPGMRRYQVVQVASDRVVVKLIPDAQYGPETLARIRTELGEVLGEATAVEPQRVDELPRNPAGKFRVVVAAGSESP
jgi:phenylacetate-CoA ligase